MLSGYVLNNNNPACGQLSFDNTIRGGAPLTGAMGTVPFVGVPDASGGSPSIVGSVYATSTPSTASPRQTKAGARASMAQPVVIFPNSTEKSGGLVKVTLTNASVDCTSGSTPTVSGSYAVKLEWFGQDLGDSTPRWHLRTFTYNSAVSPTPTASGDPWDPTKTMLSSGVPLSDYVHVLLDGAGLPQNLNKGGQTGLRGFPNGIVSITTAPTLNNEFASGYSAINVVLGKITCVADDLR
jgi:hypothetical protein